MTGSHTLMDLHGKLDRKYQVQYNFTDKPKRGTSKLGWPSSAEENLERLKNAGIPVERRMSKCGNCGGKSCDCLDSLGIYADKIRARPYCQILPSRASRERADDGEMCQLWRVRSSCTRL